MSPLRRAAVATGLAVASFTGATVIAATAAAAVPAPSAAVAPAAVRPGMVVHCYLMTGTGHLVGSAKGAAYEVDDKRVIYPQADVATAQCTNFAFNAGSATITAVFADGTVHTDELKPGTARSFADQSVGSLLVIKSLSIRNGR